MTTTIRLLPVSGRWFLHSSEKCDIGIQCTFCLLAKTKAISSCRVYVAGADLWEYSKINDGWDPEASRKVSAAGRFPFVRTVTFGLNLTFNV